MNFSTRLVDCMHGVPAAGVEVRLDRQKDNVWRPDAVAVTDRDGRVDQWLSQSTGWAYSDRWRLVFDIAGYFAGVGVATFHPEIIVVFVASEPARGYHIDVAASANGYAIVATTL
jgi:5-hydroxyisourate hydrolase